MLTGAEVGNPINHKCSTCGARKGEPCGGQKAGRDWRTEKNFYEAFHIPRQDRGVAAGRRYRESLPLD